MNIVLILCVATAGGFLFRFLGIPGGMILGAAVAVIAARLILSLPVTELPSPLKSASYILIGVIIGCMFDPQVFATLKHSWPALLGSTAILLLAGILCTWIACRWGGLDPASAYLATTPGGLQAVLGLAADMKTDTTMVLSYQLVRLYTILITIPLAAHLIARYFR